MITLHTYDERGIYIGSADYEPLSPIPGLATDVAPPATAGDQVAQWTGTAWHILDSRPPEPEPLPPTVPPSVTMRQARLALHAHGKLAAVQDAINQLPEPPKTEAQIEWDYASVVERASPFVAMLTPAIGMTDAEMDELFREASNL